MHDEENRIYIGNKGIIELTINENKILILLIKNKDRVVKYAEFSQIIYGCKPDKYLIDCIREKIFRLRRKMKDEFEIYNKKCRGYFI